MQMINMLSCGKQTASAGDKMNNIIMADVACNAMLWHT